MRLPGTLIIILTFIVALGLVLLPLPGWLLPLRPEWMAMVLIYWCLAAPERIGVTSGWIVGLVMDIATGAILGQYALSYATIAFVSLKLYQRVRVFPVWQQAVLVLVLITLHLVIVLWIKGIANQQMITTGFWIPPFTSMLLWPPVFLLLRKIRRYYQVT
jgi:rod shape-determining protein MreD